jgi:hypothetical protein
VLISFSVIRAIALMMEAASAFETPVNVYQTTRRNNPEGKSSSYLPLWEPEISVSACFIQRQGKLCGNAFFINSGSIWS